MTLRLIQLAIGLVAIGLALMGWGLLFGPAKVKYLGQVLMALGTLVVFSMGTVRQLQWSGFRRRLEKERPGEGLNSFVSSFSTDGRAREVAAVVFEVLNKHMGTMPLRATDRLVEDLHLDERELVGEIIDTIAERLNDPIPGKARIQFVGKFPTVGDLVRKFPYTALNEPSNQPLHPDALARAGERRR